MYQRHPEFVVHALDRKLLMLETFESENKIYSRASIRRTRHRARAYRVPSANENKAYKINAEAKVNHRFWSTTNAVRIKAKPDQLFALENDQCVVHTIRRQRKRPNKQGKSLELRADSMAKDRRMLSSIDRSSTGTLN